MTEETVYIPLKRFTDKDGNPTCASDFKQRNCVCKFYGTIHYGQHEKCLFPEGIGQVSLFRRGDDQTGTLIPHENCPLWSETVIFQKDK